jgi:hypothetical protein
LPIRVREDLRRPYVTERLAFGPGNVALHRRNWDISLRQHNFAFADPTMEQVVASNCIAGSVSTTSPYGLFRAISDICATETELP